MWKRFFALAITLALLVPTGVRAQSDIRLASVEVDLWPEYDKPSMLVIYHIMLSPGVSLPAGLTFRIPSGVDLNAVASAQADGSLTNLAYQENDTGEWTEVTTNVATTALRIEYYDPGLAKDGAARSFKYHWPGDYAVDSLVIQVQSPVGAENMTISPRPVSSKTGEDGMVYSVLEAGSFTAGETFDISVGYQKKTDELSAPSLQVAPSGPIDETTSGRWTVGAVLPFVIAGVGILLILGGGWWYYQSGRERPGKPGRQRRRTTVTRETASSGAGAAPAEGFIYCHQCGKRASPGDRFCRTCGAALRTN